MQENLKVLSQYGLHVGNTSQFNAYLGVSFSKTSYFSKQMMGRYIRWICSHYRDLLIIIADHLEIYNYQIFKNYPLELTQEETLRIGKEYQNAYQKAVSPELTDRVTVCLASEILAEPDCKTLVNLVNHILKSEPQFRAHIHATISHALAGKIREANFTTAETETVLETLQNYLVEEIAIILYITCKASKRYEISIFPYPPPEILIKLYEGAYSDAFMEITNGKPYEAIELISASVHQ